MDTEGPSTTTAFNKLPIELNQAIAHLLPLDCDIVSFNAVCRSCHDAIDSDLYSFWRTRFKTKFALRKGMMNKDLRKEYQRRRKYLRRGWGLKWIRGYTHSERKVVGVLKELIKDSFQGPPELDEDGLPQCPNLIQLMEFLLGSKILLNGRRPRPPVGAECSVVQSDLAAVRIMLIPLLLETEGILHQVLAAEESQQAVYASMKVQPLYQGRHKNEVNMQWVFHCFNFFRLHMTNSDVSMFYDTMQELDPSQRPSVWRTPLKRGAHPLGKHWRGTYSYLEQGDLDRIRTRYASKTKCGRDDNEYFEDLNLDEGNVQQLEFDFLSEEDQITWPAVFEDRLEAKRETLFPITTRAQHSKKPSDITGNDPIGCTATNTKPIMFTGNGVDADDEFQATGFLTALPDQCEIPGWQRISFMKHFGTVGVSDDNLWAYEGVVLPGGRIILGRWWYANDEVEEEYGGPFILWAVEPEFIDDEDSGSEVEE